MGTTTMDGKTAQLLDEAEQLVRQYELHIEDWRELQRRMHAVARCIEDRVQRVIEVQADTTPKLDGISKGDSEAPV
jgi:hypothetical protein